VRYTFVIMCVLCAGLETVCYRRLFQSSGARCWVSESVLKTRTLVQGDREAGRSSD
jgi:hypothetical protein